jgi:hypothetical protein
LTRRLEAETNGTEYTLGKGDGDDDGADAPKMDGPVDEYVYFSVCCQSSGRCHLLADEHFPLAQVYCGTVSGFRWKGKQLRDSASLPDSFSAPRVECHFGFINALLGRGP